MDETVKVPLVEKLTPEEVQSRASRKKRTKGKAIVSALAANLSRLQVEYVPIDSLRANAYNPNRQSEHDFDLLMKSMEEDGFTQPIIVSKEGVIVDGEHRWRAAINLHYKEIPIVRMDMDEARARVATIRHNRARGSHDIELEAEVLKDLQKLGALDWAAEALMMTDEELNRLLTDFSAPDLLAGTEYTDAWDPEREGHRTDAAVQGEGEAVMDERATVSLSHAALEQKRETERKIAEAKTEEERQMARKDDTTVRIICTFSGEEGAIVKKVLGDRPAEAILALCREKLGSIHAPKVEGEPK